VGKEMRWSLRMTALDTADNRTLPVKKAFTANILEDDGDEVDVMVSLKGDKTVSVMEMMIGPFEVFTLRLEI